MRGWLCGVLFLLVFLVSCLHWCLLGCARGRGSFVIVLLGVAHRVWEGGGGGEAGERGATERRDSDTRHNCFGTDQRRRGRGEERPHTGTRK